MKEIGIGLLGFGTIGTGVVAGLQKNGDLIAERVGARLVMRRIADIDLDRDRGIVVDRSILTRDAESVIRESGIDIIIELIGGTRIARDLIRKSLEAGKPVVTANKALLAEHGEEIFGLAEQKKTDIYFEGSVGGAIPVIKAIREGLVANRFESICGILNGTCNYILTRMEKEGCPFDDALKDAQARGYAEADPSLDVDGRDTAHKAVILASLARGFAAPMRAAYVEGIRAVTPADIRAALELGYRIKLLALIGLHGTETEIRVHPTLVPLGHMLACVNDVFNAILVKADMSGETMYYGRGAGRDPTAGAVIADLADVARNLMASCPRRVPGIGAKPNGLTFRKIEDTENRYYLRMSLAGKRDAATRARSFLTERGVAVESLARKRDENTAEMSAVAMTARIGEKILNAAVGELDATDLVRGATIRLRVKE